MVLSFLSHWERKNCNYSGFKYEYMQKHVNTFINKVRCANANVNVVGIKCHSCIWQNLFLHSILFFVLYLYLYFWFSFSIYILYWFVAQLFLTITEISSCTFGPKWDAGYLKFVLLFIFNFFYFSSFLQNRRWRNTNPS